ncbi:MAG TPA: DUF4129 domain-containing protein [Mycobacterium sp.]|nr:DUF4129 domain-containing protein [Mycobacterium sp.]
MPGIDKPTGRVVALIVLLILVAAALRGYLPASERTPHKEPTAHPAALVFVVVLLSVSLAIVAISIIARLRDPRTVAASAGALSERLGGRGGRPSWRVLLIGLGVIVGWLLIVLLLARWVAQYGIGQPTQVRSIPAPGNDTATPPSPSPPPQGPRNTGGEVVGYLAASTVTLLLLLVTGTVIAARKQRRIPQSGITTDYPVESPAPAVGSETLVRAAELGLAEIGNLSREPREAIIACYAAMERKLAHVPEAIPQDFDTPTEVLVRAVEHHALHADNAAQLVNLFEEARFSPHVMNEGHREVAVHVLRLVLAELRSIA